MHSINVATAEALPWLHQHNSVQGHYRQVGSCQSDLKAPLQLCHCRPHHTHNLLVSNHQQTLLLASEGRHLRLLSTQPSNHAG